MNLLFVFNKNHSKFYFRRKKEEKLKRMNEKWIWFSILVMVMKSLSSEEWEEHFRSKGSSLKNDLSLDPARLCKPGLQDTNLVKIYNGINLNYIIMKEMDIFELSTALFVNSSDTIYVSSAQTLTETIANWKKMEKNTW